MKALGFIAAWVLWLFGDVSCRICFLLDNNAGWVSFWYTPYNWFMTMSCNVQTYVKGDGKLWPWDLIV